MLDQAQRLLEVYAELARAFQFRDRERTSCHGISISGCYALEIVVRQGPATMSDLAGALFLENSTVTRLVDRLVTAGLATREADRDDLRATRVHVTTRGRQLMTTIRASLVAELVEVLRQVAPESREAVITAFHFLLEAFRARQTGGAAGPSHVCSGGGA